jgi:hypothetical protein
MMLKFVELDLTNSQRLGVILTPILLLHHFLRCLFHLQKPLSCFSGKRTVHLVANLCKRIQGHDFLTCHQSQIVLLL